MPIKTLESYLFERKLANASSIEVLQNATIGIDVDHYLSRIYTFKKEQLLSGIGGVPTSLRDYIQSDLQVFQEFNIKPLFVISGINTQLQTPNYKTNELSPQEQHLEATWNKLTMKQLYNYNNVDSFRLFTDPLPLRPMVNDLIKYFIEIGIDYMISLYDASFQLSYLYQIGMIDSIYGSTDLLLTKIDKFILGMEFQSKDFRFVDKNKVLSELHVTERQFIDLSIMVGCNIQPTTFPNFPPLPKPNQIQPFPQMSYFKLGLDIIYQVNSYGSGQENLLGYIASLNDPHLLELYYKGHAALNYVPVLNKEGHAELYAIEMAKLGLNISPEFILNTNDEDNEGANESPKDKNGNLIKTIKVANDIHNVTSQRLPTEIYFYQSIGLIPIELLESITRGQLDIRPTLESGLSDSYKKLITSKQYTNMLDYNYNLITQLLTRYYQVKIVNVKYWFQDEILELNNRLNPSISKRVSGLFIQLDNSGDKFKLSKFFKLLQPKDGNYSAKNDITTIEDVISTAMLRALYLFGVIDEKTLDLTPLGKVLQTIVNKSEPNEAELEELTLLLFLIKSNSLLLTESNKKFTSVPKFFKEFNSSNEANNVEITPAENKYITLISRVFSLHKLNISPINYQGPISRNLLNFRSHIKFINTTLSMTVESLLVDLLVQRQKNDIKLQFVNKHDWYKLIDQLPFYTDVNNTLLGVVAEIYFEYGLRLSKSGADKLILVKSIKDYILNHVYQINNPSFNINVNGINSVSADQLLSDFDSGLKFWSKFIDLVKIIHELDSTLIDNSYYTDIIDADEWLKTFV